MGLTSDMHWVNRTFSHGLNSDGPTVPLVLGIGDPFQTWPSAWPCLIHFCGPLELRLGPRGATRLCGSWTGMLHAALFLYIHHAATSLNWKVICVDHAAPGIYGKTLNSDPWVPTLWPTARLEDVPGTSAVGSCQGGRTYLAHPDVPFT